jgi:hypothetical protein
MPAERLRRPLVGRSVEVEIVIADDLEERDSHPLHTALVLGEQRQVVVHDVAARDPDHRTLAHVGNCIPDVGHRLLVEPAHLLRILSLDIGEQQDGVPLITVR